jgi:DNA-binding NarL/FixJ family response regulator
MRSADVNTQGKVFDLILLEPRELLRDCFYSLLCNLQSISIVGQAEEAEACLELAGNLHPDVIVVGDRSPGAAGLDFVSRLHALTPAPHTVLIGGNHESSDWVHRVVDCGVSGVILQQDGSGDLVAAILAAGEGRLYLSPSANALFATKAPCSGHHALTRRQLQILLLYAQGLSTKQIAYRLELSGKTVACHKDQILQRLGMRSTSDLIHYAIREGLIEP